MKPRISTCVYYGRQQGLTLVELMVAITLGLIVTAGIIQVFVGSKKTYSVEESLSRLQESGRLALEFLSNDLRMTSYWGCQPYAANVSNLLNTAGIGYIDYAGQSLTGTEGGANPDSITLRGADGSTALPLLPNNGANYDISTAAALKVATGTFSTGDKVLVSNCKFGDIFQVTDGSGGLLRHITGSGSPGNNSANLTTGYGADASVYFMKEVIYTIATGSDGQPALFRSINSVNQEVVSDVTDMQILYGEDTNGDRSVDRYVPANTAGLNFGNVYGIRVTLIMQTGDINTALAAGRINRTFSTTVSIRNRVL